jgi:hypothetical protein
VTKKYSEVVVTFNDGEVRHYRMSAGVGICRHLAMEAGQTGILTMWNGPKAYSIPLASIRDWEIHEDNDVPEPVEPEEQPLTATSE